MQTPLCSLWLNLRVPCVKKMLELKRFLTTGAVKLNHPGTQERLII
jgi:hypothetical protein